MERRLWICISRCSRISGKWPAAANDGWTHTHIHTHRDTKGDAMSDSSTTSIGFERTNSRSFFYSLLLYHRSKMMLQPIRPLYRFTVIGLCAAAATSNCRRRRIIPFAFTQPHRQRTWDTHRHTIQPEYQHECRPLLASLGCGFYGFIYGIMYLCAMCVCVYSSRITSAFLASAVFECVLYIWDYECVCGFGY